MWAVRATAVFDGETFLPDGGTVLIEGARIVGVEGPGFAPPDGCRTLDHPGTVLPGLIDTHTHLVGDGLIGALDRVAGYTEEKLESVVRAGLAGHLAAGVTTVRDLGDRRFNVTDRTPLPREPTVLTAGPPITSERGHCFYLGGEVAGEPGLRSAVAERVEHGVDVIKVMASGGMLTPGTDQLGCQFTDDELGLLVDLGHAAGLEVTAHAHSLPAVRQILTAGIDGVEHCTCLTARGPIVDPTLIDALAAAGIVVCPTVGGDIRDLGPPPPHVQALLDQMGVTADDVFGRRGELLAQLYRSGVRFTAGVDSGIAPVKPHGSVAAAVATFVEAGIPVGAALAAATSVSADVCRVATKGRIRPGHDADLLLIDGDPRPDIGALTQVAGVVLRGDLVPPAS